MDNVALMVRLSGLLFWFDQSLQASLERAGFEPVSRTQSMFFLCLASGQNKPSQIATQLGVSRQTISHIINHLSDRRLIALSTDPDDARGRIVDYGPDAHDLRAAAREAVEGLERLLEKRLGETLFRELRAGLSAPWGEVSVVDLSPRQV